jgi:opacity protein-like surface antigen
MKLVNASLVACLLAVSATPAFAQSNVYVGIDAYKDRDADVGPGVTVGMKFSPTLAGEIAYRTAKDKFFGEIRLDVIRAVVVAEMPFNSTVSGIGEIGVGVVRAKGFGASEDGTGVAAGLGVKFNATKNLGFVLKYEYSGPNDGYSSGPVLGLRYSF